MSVQSKMTAIADATRALDGSTAKLTLDGIASKLGVEKTNVTAALAAIAEKGVTVPDGSTSDALAGLIASIEAGGAKVALGTYVPTSNVANAKIAHNLGVIPDLVLYWIGNRSGGKSSIELGINISNAVRSALNASQGVGIFQYGDNAVTMCTQRTNYEITANPSATSHTYGSPFGATANDMYIGESRTTPLIYFLIAGEQYNWIAIAGLV